ncbi:U3 small nucleolar RNA-associated protein 7 [Dioscorea alata]|uniref:U3 small nucleolar RNA-associated protein 7 n=1 Tax=Dioscorea alata TaxID=55571 RepID=A0ACB7W6L7_DIOAL|nr:U3 small nucleolar RNA-associated protein 7 [Dioscorea alata]
MAKSDASEGSKDPGLIKLVEEQQVKVPEKKKPRAEQDVSDLLDMKMQKYLRGEAANLEVLQDKKLKTQLAIKEKLYGQSAKAAAKHEQWLMPNEEGFLEAEGFEKTWRITQQSLLNEVDANSSRKAFDMILPELGPYRMKYTSNGRYLLLGGRKGHLGLLDMLSFDIVKEFQVRETVRDVEFLHTEELFSVAQKKYLYIYNRHGTEIHCLKEHGTPLRLQFLDKHFLLASVNTFGQLHYQDVTTGEIVANLRTGLGRTDVMRMNPYNSIIGLGHSSGKLTMWKPTSAKPLITMFCNPGPVTAIGFHSNGHLMATAGMGCRIKLWDIRKFEVLHSYFGHASTLDFSQKGLLAVGDRTHVNVWRDYKGDQRYGRYMTHEMVKGYQVNNLVFRPYEDVLGIGHSMGISSILIPGSGEPNFDSWVANPYETKKQRREKEVHSLLDKLPPETIMLDPKEIGTVKQPRKKEKKSKKEMEEEMEAEVETAKAIKLKKKTKGRNKPSKRAKKKEEEVLKAKRPFVEQRLKEEQPFKKQKMMAEGEAELPVSLQRFARKQAA